MADLPMGPIGIGLPDIYQTDTLEIAVPMTEPELTGAGGGCITTLTYTNRVWDTQAGPGFVRWDTVGSADSLGTQYPGPGTYGVHTSDYCTEYVTASIDEVPVGTVNYVPLTGLEANAITALLCNGSLTDLAGDAVFDFNPGAVTFTANASYDGLRSALNLGFNIGTTTASAHQIPIASGITYGGMFYLDYTQTANPTPILSGQGPTAVEKNYGFKITPGNGGQYQQVPGGSPSFARDGIYEQWHHAMITEAPGRLSASLYINGKLVNTIVPGNTGTLNVLNDLWLGSEANTANTAADGFATDIFIADAEYSASQVRTLAENAFGHALP